LEKVVGTSVDNCAFLAQAGSSRQGHQPPALAVGGNPPGYARHPQQQSASMMHQPSRHMEEEEAPSLGTRRQ
jgi:hypothetical protein